MKEFRKTEDGLFICEECGETFSHKQFLGRHVNKTHNYKVYFDKWLKDSNEGVCKICKTATEFIGFKYGYKNCCSTKCSHKYHQLNMENSNLLIYGKRYPSQIKEFKEKEKKTKLAKYGHENYRDLQKVKATNLKRYNVENYTQSEEYKKRYKETCLKRYGVEHSHQNPEILEKAFRTAKLIKKYKDTNLYYQGSYELDFLEKFYNNYPDIIRGPSIKYKFNEKNKIYHSDFYIPSLNLIVEIKSSWTLKIDIEIQEKKKATIANGFNYIMILDKDYSYLQK